MFLVGLTGGIAAGKSTVSRQLAVRGARIIDADELAREVVAPGTPGLQAISERFGSAVIAPDGRLDRTAMGAIIFKNDSARQDLNLITHPAIEALLEARIWQAEIENPDGVIVYDAPLLAETAAAKDGRFSLIVVVNAPASVRIERLVKHRGLTPSEAARRIASQATDNERNGIADVFIKNDGTVENVDRQVDLLWQGIRDGSLNRRRPECDFPSKLHQAEAQPDGRV